MKKIFIMLFALLLAHVCFAQTVQNPRTLPDQYGIGDPYVLKFKGQYWLYTSGGAEPKIPVWSSWDLANWTYEGSALVHNLAVDGYAPEVIYHNGTFYMYMSPGGTGHYVFTSDSPKGPFIQATGKQDDRKIDGSVFIEDNGSLFFSYSGISARTMSSPLALDGPEVGTGAYLNGWTEGSTIFKRNGLYYMTYTGNHVISRGYRIHYGTATAPMGPYTESNQGPIVLNTDDDFFGLGHSTTFVGPDLDTYYIAYHNLFAPDPANPRNFNRSLNIDPHGFNGEKLVVYGPTNWPQEAPNLPTFYDRFDRATIGENWTNVGGGIWGMYNNELMWQHQTGESSWVSQVSVADSAADFSAEFNMKELERGEDAGKFGAIFGYRDNNNFGRAVFSSFNNTIDVQIVSNGVVSQSWSANLLSGWQHYKWHSIRVEKSGSLLKVFVDNMLKVSETVDNLSGGKIGLTTYNDHADFAYTAFSDHVQGTGIFDFHKPVPGTIEAVHYNSSPSDHSDNTAGNAGGQYREGDVDIRANPEGGYNIGWNATGESYRYNINVESTGQYHLGLRYTTSFSDAKVRFLSDGVDVTGVVDLPSTGGWDNWQTTTIKNLALSQGFHTLTMETVQGEFDFYTFKLEHAAAQTYVSDLFDSGFSPAWNYSDGAWSADGGNVGLSGWGKRTMGNTGWTDYAVEVNMQCPTTGNAGLIVRVQNPAQGGAGDNPQQGTDFYQGYYVSLQPSGLLLGKQNYNWQGLKGTTQSYTPGQWYKLKVVVKGSVIQAFVDNMETPEIEYVDTNPFLAGKVGLRGFDMSSTTRFDNFRVYSLDNDLDGYTHCADENQTCSFNGSASVAFGASGNYYYLDATNSIACNSATFADPIYGVAKSCFYQLKPNNGPEGYTLCASEGETCSFNGNASVAFGASGEFNYSDATNSIACDSATFGDPIFGVSKNCYFQLTDQGDTNPDGGACSNIPQYVNGGTYSTGDTVQNVGNTYQCVEGGWCTVGGPYEPGVGWAWNNAWTQNGSCL